MKLEALSVNDQRSGRFSIIPARAIDDRRLQRNHLHVLNALGTYSDRDGWSYPLQETLAQRLGVTRQYISQAVADLVRFGYLQTSQRGGRGLRYRVLMDPALQKEHMRCQPTLTPGETPGVASGVRYVLTPDARIIDERPNERPTTEDVRLGGQQEVKTEAPYALDELVEDWNLTAKQHGMPEVRTIEGKRRDAVLRYLKRHPEVKFWKDVFRAIDQAQDKLYSWLNFDVLIDRGKDHALRLTEGTYARSRVDETPGRGRMKYGTR